MKAGALIHRFTAKDGREVVLRTPRWEDLDDLLELINSLVDEGADITMIEKITRNEELEWLSQLLPRIEKDEIFHIVAEVDGRVIASSNLRKKKGNASHVGDIGIIIKNGYRDVGIGTELLKTLINRAKAVGLEILTLRVFSSNTRAIHVYEKTGFHETGRIPNGRFKDGRYFDEIIMVKNVKE